LTATQRHHPPGGLSEQPESRKGFRSLNLSGASRRKKEESPETVQDTRKNTFRSKLDRRPEKTKADQGGRGETEEKKI